MDTFAVLALPIRRDILTVIAKHGQISAGEIYKAFSVTPQAVSQHLKVLRDAGLVHVEKRAQQRLYQVNPESLHPIDEWIQQMMDVWANRFVALDRLLQQEKP